jgi:hypothetical protein
MDATRSALRTIMLGIRRPLTESFDKAQHVWELSHTDLQQLIQDAPNHVDDDDYDWDKYIKFMTELFPEHVLGVAEDDLFDSDVQDALGGDPDGLARYAKSDNVGLLKAYHSRIAWAAQDEGWPINREGSFESDYEGLPEIPLRILNSLVSGTPLQDEDWEHFGKEQDPFTRNKDRFGVTSDFETAFYLLPDGEMLSGGGQGAGRAYDHRNIDYVSGGTGTQDMQEFMALGAIRLMPESPGIDMVVAPTSAQYRTLSDWFDHFTKQGEVYVDLEYGLGELDERNGWYMQNPNKASHDFEKWTDASRILAFIQRFFAEGGVSDEELEEAKKKEPDFKTLKKNKVKLTDEERAEVMKREATWHHGLNGEATPAVWKAEVDGKTWFVTATHRAYNVRPTLRGAISRYHKFIKGTA